MRKLLLILPMLAAGAACAGSGASGQTAGAPDSVSADTAAADSAGVEPAIPAGALRLMSAYPDIVAGYDSNRIVLVDSTVLVYDDGREKDFKTMLEEADIEDMFALEYRPFLPADSIPGYQHDPGRVRSDALFKKLYGASAAEVGRQLVTVNWFGTNVRFSKSHGAAEQLAKVRDELQRIPGAAPYLKTAGTFYWRAVRGANRLSAHSYGIAIDIGVDHSSFWQWSGRTTDEDKRVTYQNRIPLDIVEVFERHGFVWGGRWYHFDTMHFEYRPELLPPREAE